MAELAWLVQASRYPTAADCTVQGLLRYCRAMCTQIEQHLPTPRYYYIGQTVCKWNACVQDRLARVSDRLLVETHSLSLLEQAIGCIHWMVTKKWWTGDEGLLELRAEAVRVACLLGDGAYPLWWRKFARGGATPDELQYYAGRRLRYLGDYRAAATQFKPRMNLTEDEVQFVANVRAGLFDRGRPIREVMTAEEQNGTYSCLAESPLFATGTAPSSA
jgi:hypothetical protein